MTTLTQMREAADLLPADSPVHKAIGSKNTMLSLLKQAADTLNDIASIKEQIGRAKSAVHQTGDYSDADWYHSANRALRHKQQEHQHLLFLLGEVKKQQKDANIKESENRAKIYERAFITVSKEVLSKSVYESIVYEARRITDAHDAPFINCMAAQGVEPYAKAKRKPKVVTT